MSWAGPFQIEIGKTRYSNPPKYSQPTAPDTDEDTIPLVCFSHLRWNFVYQRPQHLLSRAAADHEVIFFEEPMFEEEGSLPRLFLPAHA